MQRTFEAIRTLAALLLLSAAAAAPAAAASCPELDEGRSTALSGGAVMFVWACPAGAREFRLWSSTGGLLGVIFEGSEFILEGLAPNSSVRAYIEAVGASGEALSKPLTLSSLANAPDGLRVRGQGGVWRADWYGNGNPSYTLYELEWADRPEGPWTTAYVFGTVAAWPGPKPAYARVRAVNRNGVATVWCGDAASGSGRGPRRGPWSSRDLLGLRWQAERRALAGDGVEERTRRLESILRSFAGSGLDLGPVQDELRLASAR